MDQGEIHLTIKAWPEKTFLKVRYGRTKSFTANKRQVQKRAQCLLSDYACTPDSKRMSLLNNLSEKLFHHVWIGSWVQYLKKNFFLGNLSKRPPQSNYTTVQYKMSCWAPETFPFLSLMELHVHLPLQNKEQRSYLPLEMLIN